MSDRMILPRVRVGFPKRELAAVGPIVLAVWLVGGGTARDFVGAVLLGAALSVPFFAYAALLARRGTFGITGGELVYRGAMQTKVLASLGDDVSVVRVSRDGGSAWWQLWSGPGGTVLLAERTWSPEELAALALQTEARVTEDREELDITAFARKYPDAFHVYARHPTLSAIAVVFVVLALLVALEAF